MISQSTFNVIRQIESHALVLLNLFNLLRKSDKIARQTLHFITFFKLIQ